jgi:hypothetical protein
MHTITYRPGFCLLLFTLGLLLTVTACKKKEEIPDNYITASVGAFRFFASGSTVTTEKGLAGASSLEVMGVMSNGATLKIWIKNYSGTLVTLPLDSVSASASFLPVTPSVEMAAVHGTLTIKKVTPVLAGTFIFTCPDSSVVDGNFSVLPR